MKVLTRDFSHSMKFGSQSKATVGDQTVVYKPEEKERVLNGTYSFVPKERVFLSFDGRFSIWTVEIVRPSVPVGTVLETTFRKNSDGWIGSATHAGKLVRVIPTNPRVIPAGAAEQKFGVRVKRITAADDLVVAGEIKETIRTRRGRVVERVPISAQ